MNIELTDDEFEILKDVFFDWGSDCPYTDCDKYRALGRKLGFLEPEKPEKPLTEEEIKRRDKFAEAMKPIMQASNHLLEAVLKDLANPKIDILYGSKSLIGSKLRICLPNDYVVK